jgi:hypothetical protein
VRGLILGLYVVAALIIYSQMGWARLNEIIRIPIIEYLLVFVLAWLIGGGLWIARRLKGSKQRAETAIV